MILLFAQNQITMRMIINTIDIGSQLLYNHRKIVEVFESETFDRMYDRM